MKRHVMVLFLILFIMTLSGCTKAKQVKLEIIQVDLSLVLEDFSLQELEEMNGEDLLVSFHEDENSQETTVPSRIWGVFTTRTIMTPEDAVYALMSVRSLMQIEDTAFVCSEMREYGGEREFALQQVYKGVPVAKISALGNDFEVKATDEGIPVSVAGYYWTGIDLDVTPKVTGEEAQKAVTLQGNTKVKDYQLIVFPYRNTYFLAWKFEVRGKYRDNQDWDYHKDVYIDAMNGTILADIYMGPYY